MELSRERQDEENGFNSGRWVYNRWCPGCIVNVAGVGSTLGITTLEYEPGCVADLRRARDLVVPANDNYAHNARWGDHNGFAHLCIALLGTAKSFPVRDGRLGLGTWQQVVLCDFDDCARQREVVVTGVRE